MSASLKSYDFLDPPSPAGGIGMLGHYRVIDELGKGGMGFVFRAEDVKLKRTVALKVMNQKIAATPNSRRRFIHEARAMAAVHHDNVATIFEVGESKGTPFMAMEMLKGSTLETFNRGNTRLGYEKIIEYARQIARGLAAAHSKGIVHRDIKPANIWIEAEKDRVKILDFGLALASTPVDHLAGRGAVIGTPGYLSPEQARSEPLDDRSDLYSLGVVLYELCTTQLPIQAKTVPGQLISILAHRPKPVNELNPEIPQPLCDLIHRLLRKEPRLRPTSAAKLAEELDRVEQDCHAKSEVAQAINKLQMGLSEVVSKKSSPSIFDSTYEELEETIPDPLAVIPAPVMMLPPARPVAKQAPAPSQPAWLAYWPIAAVGALLLIALPVLTFAFSGWGRSNVAQVIQTDSTPPANLSTSQGTPSANPQPKSTAAIDHAKSNNSGNQKTASNPPAGAPKAANTKAPSGKKNSASAGQKAKNQAKKGGSAKPPSPSQTAVGENRPDNSQRVDASKNPVASSVVSMTPTDRGSSPTNTVASADPPAPPPSEPSTPPPVQLERTTVSTADGRGADAMVQIGTSENFGPNPSLGIFQRGGVESNHSYLRFDLAPIEDVKDYIQSAELVLTFVGRKRPTGAVVRVTGIPADAGMWREDLINWENSYSNAGLEKYPLLVEVTVSDKRDPRDAGENLIRCSSPELASFIANLPSDIVTLALSGSGNGNAILRFVSKDKAGDDAPKLVIEAPKEAPAGDKKKKR